MDESCLHKLPAKFLDKVEKVVPDSLKDEVYKGLQTRRPTTFRTNTLKISTEELEKKLTERGVVFEKISWYKDAFILVSPTKRELIDLDIYQEGLLYVQSFSSMIPPLILDPQKDETILDLTAAPGSKTTQMAMMMENNGKIVANDRSKVRLFKLEYNLKMQGVTNTEIVYMDGKDLWKRYPEQFDRVLVDVPCSLEGRFNCSDPKTYKDWAPGKVKMLSSMQKFLLRSAVSACKVGGTIVYSTCTLSPEENEEVIDWILEKEGDAIEILPIELNVPNAIPGFIQYGNESSADSDSNLRFPLPREKFSRNESSADSDSRFPLPQEKFSRNESSSDSNLRFPLPREKLSRNKKYDEKVSLCMRIFPSKSMEGFFVAKLRKLKSTV